MFTFNNITKCNDPYYLSLCVYSLTLSVVIYSWKYDVNITRIESRIKQNRSIFDFFVDFHGKVGDANIDALLMQLRSMTENKILVLDEKEVSERSIDSISSLC